MLSIVVVLQVMAMCWLLPLMGACGAGGGMTAASWA